ncbi:hypothetical protein [Shimia sp.]|uniref:hypothetical protein n=1 Tax=Shimia sp. TaxID=1954381 RepID=UPI003B8ADF41
MPFREGLQELYLLGFTVVPYVSDADCLPVPISRNALQAQTIESLGNLILAGRINA